MVNKVTFLDFKVGDRPPETALIRGSIGSKNALFLAAVLCFHTCFFQARNQLRTPKSAENFLRGVKIFEPCPIVLNFVQHVFQVRRKVYQRGLLPPATLVTVLASLHIVQARSGQTCSVCF